MRPWRGLTAVSRSPWTPTAASWTTSQSAPRKECTHTVCVHLLLAPPQALTDLFPRARSVDYYPPERRMMGGAAGISHHTATKAEDFSISYHKTYKVWRSAP